MLRILLAGIFGRMGTELKKLIEATPDLELAGGIDPLATDVPAAAYPVFSSAEACDCDYDVLIDFSHPAALPDIIDLTERTRRPAVIATTGHSAAAIDRLKEAARNTPILQSGNMSLGINLLSSLVRRAAAVLYPGFDPEIVEVHHRNKLDAPSGTAYMLADALREGAAQAITDDGSTDTDTLELVYDRHERRGIRPVPEIGIHSLRGGTVPGEHVVIFAGEHEVITLSHRAESRDIFAHGAIKAARWLITQTAGFYTMDNLFN
ncbi:MAG: 4-hydroxy-tetrahydrodipicolinate reductase [Clostridiaceae bacterium]|nr:4-hydroxy-tetrahydrodipicolinate reductase [Clostridiaceae bacterium]